MTIALTGPSHHTCPVELRERLAFPEEQVPEALRRLKQDLAEGGAVILNTCNRVEVYARGDAPPERIHARIREFIAESRGVPVSEFAPHLYEHHNRAAVAHLFKVTSSLDSLVVGEDRDPGAHDAYLASQSEGATDKILRAFFSGRSRSRRNRSRPISGKVSVSSVAVELAASIFGDLTSKSVMVIGSGEMGQLALKCLVEKGVGRVLVANRTLATAESLAENYRGEPIALSHLDAHLHRADIVITSTSAETPVLGVKDFEHALKLRNNAPMFVIDIAVPRDVDRAVTTLDNVYCYDMDDLESVAAQNLESRRAELSKCLEMVERQVDRFIDWRQSLYAEPTIKSMTQELHAIRERELAKTLGSLPDLTDQERDEIEYLTKRIVNNILQRPMTQIKQEVVHEDPHRVLHLVKRLFGLEERTG